MTRNDEIADGRRMRAVLLFVATTGFVTAPLWSQGFGGFQPEQFPVPQDNPPVQPAGYAFAIWGVIYVWLLGSAVFGLFRRAENAAWDRSRAPLLISLVLGTPWITVAAFSPVWAGVLIWGMLIAALTALRRAPNEDRWWLLAPVGLYTGWLTAASLVSLGLLGAGHGIGPGQTGWAWAVVFTAIAAGIAVQRVIARTALYGAGIAWALAAVAVQNFNDQATLAVFAVVGAVTVAATAIWTAQHR